MGGMMGQLMDGGGIPTISLEELNRRSRSAPLDREELALANRLFGSEVSDQNRKKIRNMEFLDYSSVKDLPGAERIRFWVKTYSDGVETGWYCLNYTRGRGKAPDQGGVPGEAIQLLVALYCPSTPSYEEGFSVITDPSRWGESLGMRICEIGTHSEWVWGGVRNEV
jgi:hypothetical protein